MKTHVLPNGSEIEQAETIEEKVGWFKYQEDSDYFKLPCINNGMLGLYNQGVDCFLREQPPKKAQSYFTLGSLVHCLILEPDKVEERFERYDSSVVVPKPILLLALL